MEENIEVTHAGKLMSLSMSLTKGLPADTLQVEVKDLKRAE